MFTKRKSHTNAIVAGLGSRTFSILSVSASLKGEINITEDLRIDGNVYGDICGEGKVIIGPEGCVKGNIKSKSVELTGKIYGDIIVSDTVILRASSYYEGTITTRNIEIEAGASFFGNCRMEDGEPKEKTGGKTVSNASVGLPDQARNK